MKDYLRRLKIILAFKNTKNKIYLIVINAITLIYSLVKEQYYLLFIVIFLLIIFYIYNKTLLCYSIILILVLSIIIVSRNIIYNKEIDYIDGNCKVYKIETYDDYDKVYIRYGYLQFIFNTNKYDLNCGDIIYIKGSVNKASLAHYENGFNYRNYLKYENIIGIIKLDELKIIDHVFCFNLINERLNEYINNKYNKDNSAIIKALLIGNKNSLDLELSKNIKKIGISHLFVISGLHIELISKTLSKFLSLLCLKDKLKNIIIFIVLLLYYFITSFLVSILRVIISMIISKVLVNKFKERMI